MLKLSIAAASFVAIAIALPVTAKAGVAFNSPLASPNGAAAPGVYFGTGNANSNFTVSTNNGIELGLSAITRFVGPIVPTSSNIYNAPLGATTAPGHTGSAWGFDFSIDLQPLGVGSLNLSNVTALLTLTDVGRGTTGSFSPFLIADNTGFGPSGKNTAALNLATDWALQNSEALSFASIAGAFGDPGYDQNANDTYDLSLQVFGPTSGDPLATDSIVVDTGAVPEPSSLAVLLAGLVSFGFLVQRRRLRQQAA